MTETAIYEFHSRGLQSDSIYCFVTLFTLVRDAVATHRNRLRCFHGPCLHWDLSFRLLSFLNNHQLGPSVPLSKIWYRKAGLLMLTPNGQPSGKSQPDSRKVTSILNFQIFAKADWAYQLETPHIHF
jgi:hypothetical protein